VGAVGAGVAVGGDAGPQAVRSPARISVSRARWRAFRAFISVPPRYLMSEGRRAGYQKAPWDVPRGRYLFRMRIPAVSVASAIQATTVVYVETPTCSPPPVRSVASITILLMAEKVKSGVTELPKGEAQTSEVSDSALTW